MDQTASLIDLIRNRFSKPDTHMDVTMSKQSGPSFSTVFLTVVKVIIALVIIAFVLFNIGYFLT